MRIRINQCFPKQATYDPHVRCAAGAPGSGKPQAACDANSYGKRYRKHCAFAPLATPLCGGKTVPKAAAFGPVCANDPVVKASVTPRNAPSPTTMSLRAPTARSNPASGSRLDCFGATFLAMTTKPASLSLTAPRKRRSHRPQKGRLPAAFH